MNSLDICSGVIALGAESELKSAHNFWAGQTIRIRRGLLEGALGRFLAERNTHRVLLEVKLHEKMVTVDVPIEDVERME